MSRLLLLPLGFLFILGCNPSGEQPASTTELHDPFEVIADQDARRILRRAMTAMGGLEQWNGKQRISFSKDFKLFREDGSIENDVSQRHIYTYKPGSSISIRWMKGEVEHEILHTEGALTKRVDGTPDTEANVQSLTNTVFSSVFVAELPYKLLDPSATISYAGKDTLDEGQIVDVIQAVYDPEVHSNHTTPDTWSLYFDEQSSIMIGYMVQHADHFSYVRNLSDTVAGGFTLVRTRDSWRVNENRELLYLRATYEYDDYEVEF